VEKNNMPIFSFRCEKCDKPIKRLFTYLPDSVHCDCGGVCLRILGEIPDVLTKDKIDSFKNKSVPSNQKDILKKRSKKHFVENCLDEAVDILKEKYGEREAIRHATINGWLDKNTGKKVKFDEFIK